MGTIKTFLGEASSFLHATISQHENIVLGLFVSISNKIDLSELPKIGHKCTYVIL